MIGTKRLAAMLLAFGLLAGCSSGGGADSGGSVVVPPPVNHAPAAGAAIPTQSATQDKAFSYTMPAASFSDADGDMLTLTATKADGSALPAWLTFSAGTFSGVPDFTDAGSLVVKVRASDGRGGSASTDFTIQVAQAPAIPISLLEYDNFKSVGLTPQALPANFFYTDNARGWGDFTGHHRLDLFVVQTTDTYFVTPRKPAKYTIYERRKDGTLVASSVRITGTDQGCLLPRKVLVADFNGDGRADAFVACTGADEFPFPGEVNTVMLSQSDGSYAIRKASSDLGFFHGASTIDANGDGKPDVIASGFFAPGGSGSSGASTIGLLINQGDGTFKRDPAWSMSSLGVFAVTVADVNEDGKPDLILGGFEWLQPARVFLNDGTANFPAIAPITLPTVVGDENSQDFLLTGTGSSRAIWVFRAGRKAPDGSPDFSSGRTIQRIAWPSLTSTRPYHDSRIDRGLPWLIAATVSGNKVVSSDLTDDASTPLE